MIVADIKLNAATEVDINRLISWFPTARSVRVWGGPKFRYPFTAETFFEDVHWQQIDSYRLVDPAGDMLAFGQIYERLG
ncbi:MAG: GNAT family N-acetyltransferase, partial [Gammaproteobacteria bacterium]